MTKIKMAPHLLTLVSANIKTSTVRYGHRDYPLGEAILETPDEGMGAPININQVTYCRFKDLDDDVAHTDGFKNLGELKEALLEFYPDITDETEVTIVRF
jgi:hypothetical protein